MRHITRGASLGRMAIGAAVVVAALTWSAGPASAHNSIVGSAPAAGSVVTEQPGQISVTTNDDLLDLGGSGSRTAMQISGPGADTPLYYGDGCVTVFGPTVETEAQLGQPGEYTVVWQVVSTDGHSVSGTFTFTWQPATGQVLAKGSPTAPTCGREAPQPGQPSSSSAGPAAGSDALLGDALWIGGATLAALLAVAVTLLVVTRRRPGSPATGDTPGDAPPPRA